MKAAKPFRRPWLWLGLWWLAVLAVVVASLSPPPPVELPRHGDKVEHLLASSAIPFVFPAVRINREYFGDGSMRQTAPISPVIHLGADRILFAADFPYEDDAEAVRFMDGANVTEEERKKIYEMNACRVFRLSQ